MEMKEGKERRERMRQSVDGLDGYGYGCSIVLAFGKRRRQGKLGKLVSCAAKILFTAIRPPEIDSAKPEN